MSYEELKKAYEESMQKCSKLEKEIEDKNLHIEHLTELLIKRNKMLFGQKSEKGRYICEGQLSLDGSVFNETNEKTNINTSDSTVVKKVEENRKASWKKRNKS